MNHCYGCKERHIWYDDDGRAHSCHEKCKLHAEDNRKREVINKKKAEMQLAEEFTSDSIYRLIRKYKQNKG